METMERIIREHPFFTDLEDGFCRLVGGCAKNLRVEANQYLFHEGDAAEHLYLLRHGRVALEMVSPTRGELRFQALGAGEIVGISSLIPPYRWVYDAKALELTRAIAIDATCLRQKCDADHDLGYEVMTRLVPILVERLHGTLLQMLDVYGTPA
jgi:CRP-like cAMP-binding protein